MKKYYAILASLLVSVFAVAGVHTASVSLTTSAVAPRVLPVASSQHKAAAVTVNDIAGDYTYTYHSLKNNSEGSVNVTLTVSNAAANELTFAYRDLDAGDYLTLKAVFNAENSTLTIPFQQACDWMWFSSFGADGLGEINGAVVLTFDGESFVSHQTYVGDEMRNGQFRGYHNDYIYRDLFKLTPRGWQLNLEPGEDPNPGGGDNPNPGGGEDPNPGDDPEPAVNVAKIAGEYTYSYRNIDVAGNVLGEGSVKFIVGVADLAANKVLFTYEEPCLGYVMNGYANFDPEALTLTLPCQPMYEFSNGWFTLARMNDMGGATAEGDIVLQYQATEDGGYFISTQKYCADEKWKESTGRTGFRNEVDYYFRRDIFRITPNGWTLDLKPGENPGGGDDPDPNPGGGDDPDPNPNQGVTVADIAGDYNYEYRNIDIAGNELREGSVKFTLKVSDAENNKLTFTYIEPCLGYVMNGYANFDPETLTLSVPTQPMYEFSNGFFTIALMNEQGAAADGTIVLKYQASADGGYFISNQKYCADEVWKPSTGYSGFRNDVDDYFRRDLFRLTPDGWMLDLKVDDRPEATVNDILGEYTYTSRDKTSGSIVTADMLVTMIDESTSTVKLSYYEAGAYRNIELTGVFDPCKLTVTIPCQPICEFGSSLLVIATVNYDNNPVFGEPSREPLVLQYVKNGANGMFETEQAYCGVEETKDEGAPNRVAARGSFIPGYWYHYDLFRMEPNDWSLDLKAASEPGTSSINAVNATANGAVEYYNLQGVRVVNPTSGIYIRRQGGTASKVLIK